MKNYFLKIAEQIGKTGSIFPLLSEHNCFRDDLVTVCDTIATEENPDDCGGDNLGFPRLFILIPGGQTITAAGDIPTPAEVQTALDAGLAVTSGRFSNGIKIPAELTTQEGADTSDGLTKVTKEIEGINGSLREFNNETIKMWAQNNLNIPRAQMFWVGDNGIWHGETTGYRIPFYMRHWEHAGDGSSAMIPFEFKWKRKEFLHLNYSDPDVAYKDLTNLAGS